jgi:hypothetical protein
MTERTSTTGAKMMAQSRATERRVRLAVKAFALDPSEQRRALRSDKALKAFGTANGVSLDWLFLGDLAPTLAMCASFWGSIPAKCDARNGRLGSDPAGPFHTNRGRLMVRTPEVR